MENEPRLPCSRNFQPPGCEPTTNSLKHLSHTFARLSQKARLHCYCLNRSRDRFCHPIVLISRTMTATPHSQGKYGLRILTDPPSATIE